MPARVTCNPTAAVAFSYDVEDLVPLIKIAHANEDRDGGGCTNFSELYAWLQTSPAGVPEVGKEMTT